ncbi:hypothetical protein QBC34DRAFT_438642 [Podospora aff. communis PSN243]|uniref:Uncharacterized protein n=1 Tax=Podospora aff. communis PSN243 TaxID=3040156 RepID=A0AAV9GKH0_9PEZI|nr:hypothetical protein QBC34DRAFT_438642 [Podospora aff. communis PSN243]
MEKLPEDHIDRDVFAQVTKVDDPKNEDPNFAETIPTDGGDQCGIVSALVSSGDIFSLTEHGDFLVGSGKTLGLKKVVEGGKEIKRYGDVATAGEEVTLGEVKKVVKKTEEDFEETWKILKAWFRAREEEE